MELRQRHEFCHGSSGRNGATWHRRRSKRPENVAAHVERHGGQHLEQSERLMKAIGIIASNTDGTPQTAQAIPAWVHMLPSLSGSFQSYKLAADVATLDALEAEAGCVVLVRFEAVDADGAPTYAELDEPHAELEAVFNAFMVQIQQPQFPTGTTPRQILAAFNIDAGGYDIYDAA